MKFKLVLWLILIMSVSGCQAPGLFSGSSSFGMFYTPRDDKDAQEESMSPEERPGYKRTFVGVLADFGFGLTAEPFFYICGYPAMCVSDDMDVSMGAVYPFGMVGSVVVAGPAWILKFVFYDIPNGIGWLFTTEKGKVSYYIKNINNLDESEYVHLTELTRQDLGDVSRHKYVAYSWGIADRNACRRWRKWWKRNRRFTMDEIRSQVPNRRNRKSVHETDDPFGDGPDDEEKND